MAKDVNLLQENRGASISQRIRKLSACKNGVRQATDYCVLAGTLARDFSYTFNLCLEDSSMSEKDKIPQ